VPDLKTESQLIEHAEQLIENYFRDEMPDLLTVEVEDAHLEIVKWMFRELPDDPIPQEWEFRIAYEKLRKAQADA
jgi:hypothetical protein